MCCTKSFLLLEKGVVIVLRASRSSCSPICFVGGRENFVPVSKEKAPLIHYCKPAKKCHQGVCAILDVLLLLLLLLSGSRVNSFYTNAIGSGSETGTA